MSNSKNIGGHTKHKPTKIIITISQIMIGNRLLIANQ